MHILSGILRADRDVDTLLSKTIQHLCENCDLEQCTGELHKTLSGSKCEDSAQF